MVTVGVVTIKKEIITGTDFLAGKGGDPAAADNVVRQIWTDKKTEQLRERLTADTVFLTMPSSSRMNVIPIQFAKYLAYKTGTPWLKGDELFNAEHNVASKNISKDTRIFNERLFTVTDKNNTDGLQNKKIIIVDDIITSGSSIRNFSEFLRKNDLNISHVVGLMGDRRLEIDQKTEDKLKELLKQKNIDIDFKSISYITRTEAGGLIRLINKARSDNAIRKITNDLQRIQRFGVVADIERAPGVNRYQRPKGKDQGNVGTGQRLQTYSSTSGVEWQIEFIRDGETVKSEKVVLAADLSKKDQQQQLSNVARRFVLKNNLGIVQTKFSELGKIVSIKRDKEQNKGLIR